MWFAIKYYWRLYVVSFFNQWFKGVPVCAMCGRSMGTVAGNKQMCINKKCEQFEVRYDVGDGSEYE